MKRIIQIGVVGMVVLMGCEGEPYHPNTTQSAVTEKEKVLQQMYGPAGYEVVTVDSCEYLVGWGGGGYGGPIMTHKGNCKYCRQRQEQLISKVKQ